MLDLLFYFAFAGLLSHELDFYSPISRLLIFGTAAVALIHLVLSLF